MDPAVDVWQRKAERLIGLVHSGGHVNIRCRWQCW